MGSVVLAGATSGSTTLTPVDAVTATITPPSVTGTLATLAGTETLTNKTLTSPIINTPSTSGQVYSSTYTPTITNGVNVDGSTAFACRYVRIGDVVTVSGQVNVDPTAASTYTRIEMSLPIASNLSNSYELCGVASGATAAIAHFGILASTADDRAIFDGQSSSTVNQAFYFTFSYLII